MHSKKLQSLFIATCLLATSPAAAQAPKGPLAPDAPSKRAPISLFPSIIVSDAIDLGGGWAEVTTVAMAPGEHLSCPQGRLFFANGYKVLATTLAGSAEALPANPWVPTYSETYAPLIIYDNHLIKLKNGHILLTLEGTTWNDNVSPKPAWWNLTVEYPAKGQARAGARANLCVFRSTDCGTTWSLLSEIDAAKLIVPHPVTNQPVEGLCGTPRLWSSKCDGKKCASLGGWDGHFAYADPYDGNVYITSPCAYGTGKVDEEKFLALLLRSTDSGVSWSVIGRREGQAGFRAPVISFSDRVAFAQVTGPNVVLTTFDSKANSVDLTSGSVVSPYPGGPVSAAAKVNTNVWRYRALARDLGSSAGFVVSVPYWKPYVDVGVITHRLFRIPKVGGQATLVGNPIQAESIGGDTLHGTFIPGLPNDNLAAFYWVERVTLDPKSKSANPFLAVNEFRVHFQVYRGTKTLLGKPGELTVEAGKPYRYKYVPPSAPDKQVGAPGFVGDYMGGAAYLTADGTRRFVATWSESGKLRFNTISVPGVLLTSSRNAKLRFDRTKVIRKEPQLIPVPETAEAPLPISPH